VERDDLARLGPQLAHLDEETLRRRDDMRAMVQRYVRR